MGIKYLSWRSTLYAATCQCYYDCKYNEDGEVNKKKYYFIMMGMINNVSQRKFVTFLKIE